MEGDLSFNNNYTKQGNIQILTIIKIIYYILLKFSIILSIHILR